MKAIGARVGRTLAEPWSTSAGMLDLKSLRHRVGGFIAAEQGLEGRHLLKVPGSYVWNKD